MGAAIKGLRLNRAKKRAVAVTVAMRVVLRREVGNGIIRVWRIWGLGFWGGLGRRGLGEEELTEEREKGGGGVLKEREEKGVENRGRGV